MCHSFLKRLLCLCVHCSFSVFFQRSCPSHSMTTAVSPQLVEWFLYPLTVNDSSFTSLPSHPLPFCPPSGDSQSLPVSCFSFVLCHIDSLSSLLNLLITVNVPQDGRRQIISLRR